MSAPETRPEVQLRVARVVLRERSPQQWVFLQEAHPREGAEPRGFPIVIGSGEAFEIHRVLHSEETPRPLTHELAGNLIDALGSRVIGVDIVDLRANTFYAQLRLEAPRTAAGDTNDPTGAEEILVDARPSDALALALRVGAPIRVSESILEEARTDDATDPLPEADGDEDGGETFGPEDPFPDL